MGGETANRPPLSSRSCIKRVCIPHFPRPLANSSSSGGTLVPHRMCTLNISAGLSGVVVNDQRFGAALFSGGRVGQHGSQGEAKSHVGGRNSCCASVR